MIAVLLPIALIAYIVGLFLATLGIVYRQATLRVLANVVFVLGWAAHLGSVIKHGFDIGRFPLSGAAEYLLVLSLVVMTLHLALALVWHVHAAGIILPPLAALTGFAAMELLPMSASKFDTSRPLFLFHTTVSTLGMATLIVALGMSLIYLFQDHALKARRTLRVMEGLPPLDRCDRIGLHALLVGFILLTLGIVAGVTMNRSLYERLFVPGFKQTFPVLAWLIFATILVARFKLGFRGRKSAYLTIAGVMLGLLTIVGMTI